MNEESKSTRSSGKKTMYTDVEKREALRLAAQHHNFSHASRLMRENGSKKRFDERSLREWANHPDYKSYYEAELQKNQRKPRTFFPTS